MCFSHFKYHCLTVIADKSKDDSPSESSSDGDERSLQSREKSKPQEATSAEQAVSGMDGQKCAETRSRDFLGAGHLRAALARAKYSQLIDSDETEEQDIAKDGLKSDKRDNKPLIQDTVPHLGTAGVGKSKSEPRERKESSSSYADEDFPSGKRLQKNDFGYHELDDEFGSRPVDPSGALTVKPSSVDNESVQFVSNSDPIVGHEYGVRPLLDDDELQEAYGSQNQTWTKAGAQSHSDQFFYTDGMTNQGLAGLSDQHGSYNNISGKFATQVKHQTAIASEPAEADFVDHAAMTTSSSSVVSPELEAGFDVFSAAPFKQRSSKRSTPASVLASGTSSANVQSSDVFEGAPFKHKTPRSNNSSTVTSPGSCQSVTTNTANSRKTEHHQDVFGSTPFRASLTPSSTGPSSSTVSPTGDSMCMKTPDEAQPGSLPGMTSSFSGPVTSNIPGTTSGLVSHQVGAVPVKSHTWSQSGTSFGYNMQMKNGFSMDSPSVSHTVSQSALSRSPSEVGVSNISEDPFGAVPLTKAMKRSVKKVQPEVPIPMAVTFSATSFPQTLTGNVTNNQHELNTEIPRVHPQAGQFPVQPQGQYYPLSSALNIQTPPEYIQQNLQAVTRPSYQTTVSVSGQQQMPATGAAATLPFTQYYGSQQQLLGNIQHMSPEGSLQSQQQLPLHSYPVLSSKAQVNLPQPIPVQQNVLQQQTPLNLFNKGNQQTAQQNIYNPGLKQSSTATTQARSFAQRPGDLPMTSSTSMPQPLPHSQQFAWDFTSQDDIDWDNMGDYDDESKYQRLKARNASKRSSRDVSISAFANMSFNDEDEFSLGSQSCESPSISQEAASSTQNIYMSNYPGRESSPSSCELGKAVVVAAAAGYDSGTWPRKHRRHQTKAEPFSVSKK